MEKNFRKLGEKDGKVDRNKKLCVTLQYTQILYTQKSYNFYVPYRHETSGLSIAMIGQHHYIHINALYVNANTTIDSKSFPAKNVPMLQVLSQRWR